MDKDNASADALRNVLKGYATGIASLLELTDEVDHVDIFAIRGPLGEKPSFNVLGWRGHNTVFDFSNSEED